MWKKVTIRNNRAWNILDEYFDTYVKAGRSETFEDSQESTEELKTVSPVNLLELESRNDYAAGLIEKKNIFKRVMMALLLVGLIAVFSSCKKVEDKIAMIKLAVATPKDAAAYLNRGMAYYYLGQYTKAISDFNKAIELNPKYAEAYNSRGFAYYTLGQSTKAISDYTKAIELNPNYAEAYSNRALAYYNLGQYYTKAISDFNKAISDLNKAIELNPKFALAYLSRGIVYAALGKSEEAKKDLLKAGELNPALKEHVKTIPDYFKLGLEIDDEGDVEPLTPTEKDTKAPEKPTSFLRRSLFSLFATTATGQTLPEPSQVGTQ